MTIDYSLLSPEQRAMTTGKCSIVNKLVPNLLDKTKLCHALQKPKVSSRCWTNSEKSPSCAKA